MSFIPPLSLVGVSASIFLGILYLSKGRLVSPGNSYLGLFFLLLAVRLGKLAVQSYASVSVNTAYFNLMHAAFLALGPSLLLYVRGYVSAPPIRTAQALPHFIPSALFLVGAYGARGFLGEEIWSYIYWFTLMHPLAYAGGAGLRMLRSRNETRTTRSQIIWLASLISGVVIIAGMNILYYFIDFPFYVVTAVLLLVTVYLVSYLSFTRRGNLVLGKIDMKYGNQNLSTESVDRIWNELVQSLVERRLYLDTQLTLASLSEKLHHPTHIISRVVNEKAGRSFPDYINSLRIGHARQTLNEEPEKKIIAVALESGFHSLSAFNRAFRKHTGANPSSYRKKNT